MGYEKIDHVLDERAKAHNVHVYREYKDVEVRSVEDRSGEPYRFQIWIDEPEANGMIAVHVWDLKRNGQRNDFLASEEDLKDCLEKALEIAKRWGTKSPMSR
jgi:hypothetical protein